MAATIPGVVASKSVPSKFDLKSQNLPRPPPKKHGSRGNAYQIPDIEIEEVSPPERRTRLEKFLIFFSVSLAVAFVLLLAGCFMWYRQTDLVSTERIATETIKVCNIDDTSDGKVCCTTATDNRQVRAPEPLCVSEACVEIAHRLLSHSDRSQDPCKDFFQFACGGWQRETEVPEDQLYHAVNLNVLRENVDRQMKRILESPKKEDENKAFGKIKDFYRSCMASPNYTTLAQKQVQRLVERMGGFQTEDTWKTAGKTWNLSNFLADLLLVNGAPIFDVTIDIDVTNRSRFAIVLGLPRQYGLIPTLLRSRREAEADQMIREIHDLSALDATQTRPLRTRPRSRSSNANFQPSVKMSDPQLAQLVNSEDGVELDEEEDDVDGDDDDDGMTTAKLNGSEPEMVAINASTVARKKIYNVLSESIQRQKLESLEKKIDYFAHLHDLDEEHYVRDFRRVTNLAHAFQKIIPNARKRKMWEHQNKIYNPFTIDQLDAKFNFISWKPFLEQLFQVSFNGSEPVYVAYPDYFRRLSLLLKFTDARIIHNTLLLLYARDVLDELVGSSTTNPRWRFCTQATSAGFGDALAGLYLRQFDEEELRNTERKVEEIFSSIKGAVLDGLGEAHWMDRNTRAEAVRKVQQLRGNFVAAPFYRNETFLEQSVEDVKMSPGDFFGNVMQMYKLFRKQLYEFYNQPVEEDTVTWAFITFPFIVNAFYIQQFNSIVVPLAILTPPHFMRGLPSYVNYGSMGTTLAHEILHGFDGIGHAFDADGVLRDWWSPEAKTRFVEDTECVASNYLATFHRDVNINEKPVRLQFDGNFTRNENTADLGGMKYALKAYQRWSSQQRHSEPLLPGLNMTRTQVFFLSTAQAYCSVMTPLAYVFLLEMDEHTPHPERVNAMLRNTPEFSEAFKCPLGSPMNPVSKCSVW